MAAIDEMYCHSYYEYDDLRRWAIAYYPELLFYFYDIALTYKQWEDNCSNYVKQQIAIAKRNFSEVGHIYTPILVDNIIKRYKEEADYDCPKKQAEEEAAYIQENFNRTAEDWENSYTFPIMNTPFSVDKKLLWICPVPCVRKYLEEHCGYKTKWYHKIFWRGKKYFNYDKEQF